MPTLANENITPQVEIGDVSPKQSIAHDLHVNSVYDNKPTNASLNGRASDAHTYSYQYSPHILYSPNLLYPAGFFPGDSPEMEVSDV